MCSGQLDWSQYCFNTGSQLDLDRDDEMIPTSRPRASARPHPHTHLSQTSAAGTAPPDGLRPSQRSTATENVHTQLLTPELNVNYLWWTSALYQRSENSRCQFTQIKADSSGARPWLYERQSPAASRTWTVRNQWGYLKWGSEFGNFVFCVNH